MVLRIQPVLKSVVENLAISFSLFFSNETWLYFPFVTAIIITPSGMLIMLEIKKQMSSEVVTFSPEYRTFATLQVKIQSSINKSKLHVCKRKYAKESANHSSFSDIC